jgi:hypothetical protein
MCVRSFRARTWPNLIPGGPCRVSRFAALSHERLHLVCTCAVVVRRVQCPASNSTGSAVGPEIPIIGFHVTGPARRMFGIRRAIRLSASASWILARCAPRQCTPLPNEGMAGAPARLMLRRSGSSQTSGSRPAAAVLTNTSVPTSHCSSRAGFPHNVRRASTSFLLSFTLFQARGYSKLISLPLNVATVGAVLDAADEQYTVVFEDPERDAVVAAACNAPA